MANTSPVFLPRTMFIPALSLIPLHLIDNKKYIVLIDTKTWTYKVCGSEVVSSGKVLKFNEIFDKMKNDIKNDKVPKAKELKELKVPFTELREILLRNNVSKEAIIALEETLRTNKTHSTITRYRVITFK